MAIALLMLTVSPQRAAADEQVLQLAVEVNGFSISKIGEFVLRDGVLLARRAELGDLGFRVPATRALTDAGPDSLVALSDLPGLSWRIDQATQTVYVKAVNNRLVPTLLRVEGSASGGAVESGTGATLDYDINGTFAGGSASSPGRSTSGHSRLGGSRVRGRWPMQVAGRAVLAQPRRCGWTLLTPFPTRTRCAAIVWAT